jgi:hypothetical protein
MRGVMKYKILLLGGLEKEGLLLNENNIRKPWIEVDNRR